MSKTLSSTTLCRLLSYFSSILLGAVMCGRDQWRCVPRPHRMSWHKKAASHQKFPRNQTPKGENVLIPGNISDVLPFMAVTRPHWKQGNWWVLQFLFSSQYFFFPLYTYFQYQKALEKRFFCRLNYSIGSHTLSERLSQSWHMYQRVYIYIFHHIIMEPYFDTHCRRRQSKRKNFWSVRLIFCNCLPTRR